MRRTVRLLKHKNPVPPRDLPSHPDAFSNRHFHRIFKPALTLRPKLRPRLWCKESCQAAFFDGGHDGNLLKNGAQVKSGTKAPATGMDKISLDRNRNYARIVGVRDEAKRKRRNKEGYPAPTTFGASGILQSLFPDRSVPAFMVFLPNEPTFWTSQIICKLLQTNNLRLSYGDDCAKMTHLFGSSENGVKLQLCPIESRRPSKSRIYK